MPCTTENPTLRTFLGKWLGTLGEVVKWFRAALLKAQNIEKVSLVTQNIPGG